MSIRPEELWAGYDVLIGGLGALPLRRLTDEEARLFDKFAEWSENALAKISPEIAKDFRDQVGFFKTVAEVFGAKVDKPFGGLLPASGQYGVGLIIPQDIRYVVTATAENPAYSGYGINSWDISLTAGTVAHLLGDGTNYFKPKPTVGQRCAIVIMKNGIVEIGTTPKVNQIIFKTERITYPAFSVHPLVDQIIEKGTTIYRYNFPAAMPIFYDFGVMLQVMPIITGTSNIRLFGIILYEYDHRKELKWIT